MRKQADDVVRYAPLRARRSSLWPMITATSVYVSSVIVVFLLVLHAADRIVVALTSGSVVDRSTSSDTSRAANVDVAHIRATSKVLGEDWNESIATESFWRSSRSASSGRSSSSSPKAGAFSSPPVGWLGVPPSYDWRADHDDDDRPRVKRPARVRQTVAGRTICVRLCDGSFFPIGFGSANLSRDAAACERRCPGAKLYVQRVGEPSDTELDGFVDLSGEPYSKLKNANLFRTSYDASCKCRPDPWEPEARERHRIYALEEKRRKGDKAATAELKQIQAAKQAEAKAARERRARRVTATLKSVAPVASAERAPDPSTASAAAPANGSAVQPPPAVSPSATPQPGAPAVASAQPDPQSPEPPAAKTETSLEPLTGGSVPATEPGAKPEVASDEDARPRVLKNSRRRTAHHRQPRRAAERSARPQSPPSSSRSWVSTAFGQ